MRDATLVLLLAAACATPDADKDDDTDADIETGTDSAADTDADTDVATTPITTRAPFTAPADPLGADDPEGCAVLDETTCDGATRLRCAPYDVVDGSFPESIDALQRRVWLQDRAYDLHHSPDGQTSDRSMNQGFPPGTPEFSWAAPEAFRTWDGYGDSAIWTGVATNGAMMRWLTTGTEADRLRFEDKVRTMLTQFEVTDAIGYLARAHFLIVPDGTPTTPEHLTLTETAADDPIRFTARDPSHAPDLPAGYDDGVPDGKGGTVTGRVGWQGHPSIDQYTGAMVTLPAAWSVLTDQDLKDRIAAHLTGYLRRLERVEIRNLSGNPELAEAAAAALGAGLSEDPDLDISTLDTIVLFGLPTVAHANEDDYPREPPTELPTTPSQVLDATDPGFLGELLALVARLSEGRADGWDHVYAPSVRGGDAVHMLHLALMGWHMTGEDRYRAFLEDDLLASIHADRIANTMGALVLPPWCRAFYGDHITLPPLWALLNLLDEGPLRDELVRAMVEEGDGKMNVNLGNAKFDLMIADAMDDTQARHGELVAEATTLISELGGNGGMLDEPRRTYTIDVDDLKDELGEPLPLSCPTEAQRATCEDGFSVLGLTIPGESITHECIGHPLECDQGDGTCAWAVSDMPLPMAIRPWEDFLWQRSPYKLGAAYAPEGAKSSPGLDLTESYWLGRVRGVFEDTGLVLAWMEDGVCEGK